jgi:hypothetical protein
MEKKFWRDNCVKQPGELSQTQGHLQAHQSSMACTSSSTSTPADAGVDTNYFKCRLRDLEQPDGICGGRNDTPRMNRGKLTRRFHCERCRGNITKLSDRTTMTEKEFVDAGGRSEPNVKRGRKQKSGEGSGNDSATRTPATKRSYSEFTLSTPGFGSDMNTLSPGHTQAANPSTHLPTLSYGQSQVMGRSDDFGYGEMDMYGNVITERPSASRHPLIQSGHQTVPEAEATFQPISSFERFQRIQKPDGLKKPENKE